MSIKWQFKSKNFLDNVIRICVSILLLFFYFFQVSWNFSTYYGKINVHLCCWVGLILEYFIYMWACLCPSRRIVNQEHLPINVECICKLNRWVNSTITDEIECWTVWKTKVDNYQKKKKKTVYCFKFFILV